MTNFHFLLEFEISHLELYFLDLMPLSCSLIAAVAQCSAFVHDLNHK